MYLDMKIKTAQTSMSEKCDTPSQTEKSKNQLLLLTTINFVRMRNEILTSIHSKFKSRYAQSSTNPKQVSLNYRVCLQMNY